MEFPFHLIVLLASFVFVGQSIVSDGATSTQDYWNQMLPNTPMPNAIQDSLQSDITGVNVGNKGVDVNVGGHGGKESGQTHVDVGKGGTTVTVGPKRKRTYVDVKPGHKDPFKYIYGATNTQVNDNPNVAVFFLEKDLKPGTHMNLHFTKPTNIAPFLPRPMARSIPFNSDHIHEILNRFGLKPGSAQSEVVKETIKECEEKGIKGEEKYCATSLESMVDFATSKLGKNLHAMSTHVEKEMDKLQKYVITGVTKVNMGIQSVTCHKQNYMYAVFYCHKTESTMVYKVSMIGQDGAKVKAVVVCHTDTSKWNHKHLAFQVLKVKPGTVPICHFLPQDHVVWVLN